MVKDVAVAILLFIAGAFLGDAVAEWSVAQACSKVDGFVAGTLVIKCEG